MDKFAGEDVFTFGPIECFDKDLTCPSMAKDILQAETSCAIQVAYGDRTGAVLHTPENRFRSVQVFYDYVMTRENDMGAWWALWKPQWLLWDVGKDTLAFYMKEGKGSEWEALKNMGLPKGLTDDPKIAAEWLQGGVK